MHASGRVRVAVAFVVAMALHVLMISTWPASQEAIHPVSSIRIVGLYQEHAAEATTPVAVKQPVQHRATIKHQTAHATTLTAKAPTKTAEEPVVIPQPSGPDEDASDQAPALMPKSTVDRTAVGEVAAPADRSLPASVYAGIMAEMRYPRMARRNGWQGEVALRLDVRGRTIRQVTMLASSGYPLLDRAAHRGIGRIQTLPLADGFYRLPVIFRLQ